MTDRLNVYIASAKRNAPMIDMQVATALEARGCFVVSSWHALRPYPTAEGEAQITVEDAARIRQKNMADLARADACLVIATEDGGEHLGEAAIAFNAGLAIVWTGRLTLTGRQPTVVRCESVTASIEAVAALARAKRGRAPTYPPPAMTGTES